MRGLSGAAFILSAIAIGGCSDAGGNASTNAAPANVAATSSSNLTAMTQGGDQTAPASDIGGARALLERHYAQYRANATPSMPRFTPELTAAIRRTSGLETGGLDHDPFCACQDFENFSARIESVTATPEGAVARVAITNMGESRTVVIRLANRGGTWMVADVGEGEDSLLNAR